MSNFYLRLVQATFSVDMSVRLIATRLGLFVIVPKQKGDAS